MGQSSVSTRDRDTAHRLALASCIGVVVYLAIDALLVALRPDLSFLHNAESDYGRGKDAWIMDLNFLLRGALSLAIVAALWKVFPENRSVRRGTFWILSWAAGSGLLAFFADNPPGYPRLWSGPIHLLLAFLAFLCVIVGVIWVSSGLRREKGWTGYGSLLMAVSVLAVLALLLLGRAGFRPASLGGLYEKIFLFLMLLWMFLVGLKIAFARESPS